MFRESETSFTEIIKENLISGSAVKCDVWEQGTTETKFVEV